MNGSTTTNDHVNGHSSAASAKAEKEDSDEDKDEDGIVEAGVPGGTLKPDCEADKWLTDAIQLQRRERRESQRRRRAPPVAAKHKLHLHESPYRIFSQTANILKGKLQSTEPKTASVLQMRKNDTWIE